MKAIISFLVASCALPVAAWAGELVPGSHDALAVQWLRNMARDVPLRVTRLSKVAPEWAVVRGPDLTWEQAVAEADARFGNRQLERTAFLRRYLRLAVTDAQLTALKLPRWNVTRTGPFRPFAVGSENNPTAVLEVCASRDVLVLGSPPTLTLMNVTVNGVVYGELHFDEEDRLTAAICHTRDESDMNFRVGVSRWENETGWWASVWVPNGISGQDVESLQFTPTAVLYERSVRVEAKNLYYREIYEAGKLRKRIHYQDRKVDGAISQTEVVREESFP